MKLKLYRGLPGSGKTTAAKKDNSCLILENDMFLMDDGKYAWTPEKVKKAISLVMSIAESALSFGADVVVSNTFIKRCYVDAYRRLAEKYGAEFEVIRMAGDFGNVHNVPEKILRNMKEGFEDWPGEIVVKPEKPET